MSDFVSFCRLTPGFCDFVLFLCLLDHCLFSEVVFIHRVLPHLISLCDYFPSPKDHFVGCCGTFCIVNVELCVFMDVFGHLKRFCDNFVLL